MITVLHFTATGRFHCDGLGSIHPGLRPVRIGGGLQPGEVGCESCPRFAKCGLSHISTIATEVTDLAAVEALCKEKGWTFVRDQRTYAWFGESVGDYPLPAGMKAEDLGKCSHAIKVPGCKYEIGLVRNAKTGGYRLAYDFWGPGKKLQEAIGQDGGAFLQGYGVCKATMIAKAKGYIVQRSTLPNGTIKLQVSGV